MPEYHITHHNGTEIKVETGSGPEWEGNLNDQPFALDVSDHGPGVWHVIRDGQSYRVYLVSWDQESKTCILDVNGYRMTMKVENAFDQLLHSMGLDDLISKKVNEVKAPMPGKVLAIHVEDGSEVKEGDSLLVLEAMKMENVIKSPVDATVRQIRVKAGGTVEKNEILIEF